MPQLPMTCFICCGGCWISDVHVEWSKQGPVPSRTFVASFYYDLQSCAHFQWKLQMRSRQRCQLFHKRAFFVNGLFFLLWCRSCTFEHDCTHQLFPGLKNVYFFFSNILVSLFFGMHSGQEFDPFVYFGETDNSEIVAWSNAYWTVPSSAFAKSMVEWTCSFSSCEQKWAFGISAPWPEELTYNNCQW